MASRRPYRFGFVLTTGAGNLTRFLNLKGYAERDPEVECIWAVDPTTVDAGERRGPVAHLRARLQTLSRAAPVLDELGRLDAVMFHAFEPYVLAALRNLVAHEPLLVWSRDDPPSPDPTFWAEYGLAGRSRGRARLRFAIDSWCAGRVSLFIPMSTWAAQALARDCSVPPERIHAIHVGVDLEQWSYAPRADLAPGSRAKILFVGGDFHRKGGDILLDLYRRRFALVAELHLVTRSGPIPAPPDVFVYDDLQPNDERLRRLYREADLLVLPTRGDLAPFAVLEAMASGVPVVASDLPGVADMIHDGETGFIAPPRDAEAFAERIQVLLDDAGRRRGMGAQGRALVEREFSAAVNVPRILGIMKCAVVNARGRRARNLGFPSAPSDG